MSNVKDSIRNILNESVNNLINNESFIDYCTKELSTVTYYFKNSSDKLIYIEKRMTIYDLHVDPPPEIVRIYSILRGLCIMYVDQIIKNDEEFFLKQPNFGKKSLINLKKMLSEKNIQWETNNQETENE